MKQKRLTIFHRFAVVILLLITILGALFITITYLSTTNYHQASTQLLNKDVAKHVAEFTKAFTMAGINKREADSVFHDAMVLNPNTEVYFLDTAGKVIYYDAKETDIKQWKIDTAPIKKYLLEKGEAYIKGVDPKDPATLKIFSAAEVSNESRKRGYIYIILGSQKSENILDTLFGSHILKLAIKAFIVVLLLSLLFSFLYLRRLGRNFRNVTALLQRFENGDFEARFPLKQNDELQPITHAFNKMADLLTTTISKLSMSEAERKSFIAAISHDLRTPLSIARGYAETLAMKQIKEQGSENFVELIQHKLLQIESMVQQLFELSKLDAVEFKPHKEPFVLSEIVQETVNTFQQVAAAKQVKLECTQCLYHVWVNGDVRMLERVFQNLGDNAVKSTPASGYIKTWLEVSNNMLVFNIENTGIPLSAALLEWINHPTGTHTLPAKHPAQSGLGLSIVQKILRHHNSSLTASSGKEGNLFTFSLPVYEHSA